MFIQQVLASSLLLVASTAAADVVPVPACTIVDFLPLASQFTAKEQTLALEAFTKGAVPQNSCLPVNATEPVCDAPDCVKLLGSVNKMLDNLDLIPSCTETQSKVVLDKVTIGDQLTASQKSLVALCPKLPELLAAASATTPAAPSTSTPRPFAQVTGEAAGPTAASLASLALLVLTLTALL